MNIIPSWKFLWVFLFVIFVIREGDAEPRYQYDGNDEGYGFRRHISDFAPKSKSNGCRIKPEVRHSLLGPAQACSAKKPLKLTKALKLGKDLCAKDWHICSIKDKAVQQLSWKNEKMPKGCFAFNYGKLKAAGYGNHCHANLYFDGILCCPIPGTKVAHHHKTLSSSQGRHRGGHKVNLIE